MEYNLHQIPFFNKIENSKNILLCGAGGGFDIYSGIPLYFNLKQQGKNVIISNLSFTWLEETTSSRIFPNCYSIQLEDQDISGRNYFPEKILKSWFDSINENVEVYAFNRVGVKPLKDAYNFLIDKYNIDTIILIDGGTDSLMFGDEEGLGTPQEDMCSMAAVHQTEVKHKYLVSIGFGIDSFHGVSHYDFLENISTLQRTGGYLGLFQLNNFMKESELFLNAIDFANQRMVSKESIVSNSIASALDGNYGNIHRTKRTVGTELWINPLMTIYWCFELGKVIDQLKYYDNIKDISTMGEFNTALTKFRDSIETIREKKKIPI